MEILQAEALLIILVWLHYTNYNETPGEKARWKLHKNASGYFEGIQEADIRWNSGCTATYLPFQKSFRRESHTEHC